MSLLDRVASTPIPSEDCACEFDAYDDPSEGESWHYRRTCVDCGYSWWGLHCPHDGAQNNCPGCGKRPDTVGGSPP